LKGGDSGFQSPAGGRYGAMLATRDVSEAVGIRAQTRQTAPDHSVLAFGGG
jgi:hypothetical protein